MHGGRVLASPVHLRGSIKRRATTVDPHIPAWKFDLRPTSLTLGGWTSVSPHRWHTCHRIKGRWDLNECIDGSPVLTQVRHARIALKMLAEHSEPNRGFRRFKSRSVFRGTCENRRVEKIIAKATIVARRYRKGVRSRLNRKRYLRQAVHTEYSSAVRFSQHR